jgi:transcriptional/translational regulatory protein YebC/TACO1
MGVFKLKSDGLDTDELELELIDHGLEDMGEGVTDNDEPCLVVRADYQDFGTMQSALESKGLEPISSELEWVPQNMVELTDEKAEEVLKLIAKMEEDEDVQRVFYNLK